MRVCALTLVFVICSLIVFSQENNLPPTLNAPRFPALPAKVPLYKSQASNARTMAFTFPISDCATYTFKMLLGNSTAQNHISDILGNTTGNSFQAGYTTINGGQQDALLQQLDINGQVIWSKTLGVPSKNERIHRMAFMPDGNIVLTGTSEDAGGANQQPFIALSDIDGNLLWMKILQTATNYRGVAVYVGEGEDIGMVAEDGTTMLYGRFDKTGALKWMNKVQALPQSTTVGIVVGPYDFFDWYIAYTGTQAGRKVGGILTINAVDGAIKGTRQFGGTADNADFIFHDMQYINSRPRIIGVYAVNGGPYQLFKMSSVNGFITLGLFETYQMPAITFDETASSVLTDRADVIAFMNTTGSNDLYMLKCIGEEASNFNFPPEWTKQFTGFAGYRPSAIDRVADAGFLVACNAPGAKPLLLKTDSAAWLGGCEGVAFTINRTASYASYTTQAVSNIATVLVPPVSSPAYTFQPALIDTQFTCRQLTCPLKPIEDTCINTFYRGFRSTHHADGAADLSVNASNEVMVTGAMRDDGYEPGTQHAILVKFDAKGKLMNRKKVLLGDGAYLGKQFQMKDGNLLVLGSASYNGKSYGTISKISDNLTMLWNKALPRQDVYNDFFDLIEDANGDIYLLFQNDPYSWSGEQLSLIKLDATGNLLYRKDYKPATSFTTGTSGSICQDDLYIYGTISMPNAASTMLFKMEKATGNLVWSKKITGPGPNISMDRNLQILQDKLVLSGFVPYAGKSVTAVLFLDKDGNQVFTTSFSYKNQAISNTALVTKNDELVMSGFMYDNSLSPYRGFNVFLRLDANGNVLHSKRIFSTDTGSPSNLVEATDGGFYEIGGFSFNNPYTSEMYLKKYAFDGTMGNCMSESYSYQQETTAFNIATVAFNTNTSPLPLISLPYSEEDYSLQQNRLICSSPIVCIEPELTGPTSICSASLVYEYRAKRMAGCTAPVSWEFDTKMIKSISTSDTLLKVQFIGNGVSKIYSGVFSGCRLLKDSIEVQAAVVVNNLELGNDTILCTGTSVELKANTGFVDYTWQDGSTAMNYTVTAPGKYYVTVSDACGAQLSDTLIVSAAPPIVFDIGNDTSLCVHDKVKVTAPTGFLHYTWTPNYNIDNTNTNTVTLSPVLDTIYRIAAEKTPGCFGYDSIRITIKHPLPLQIGNDTSFCAGGSVTYSLGSGFQQQQWSNGSTNASILVNSSGTFSVIATATNSCISYDTAKVIVYTNPKVTLPPDAALCLGTNTVLDAGNGFASYLWQDGSTASRQTVQNAGTYWVQVTDGNNCKASDTTAITRINPLPVAFLPGDTTLCSFAKLEIHPRNKYATYLWSTNAVSSGITVQQAGTYWLEVQDANGCTGRDSLIVLPKHCLQGFFAPDAFSPNGDGKNETFKPILMGTVVKYQLLIFNRWGQVVFQSSDWNTGWDGNLAGKPQNTGAFVWICTYQFEDGPVQNEKGKMVLVR